MADDHHNLDSGDSNPRHGPLHGYTDTGSHALPGGLTVAANGLQLEVSDTRIDPSTSQEWSYQVQNERGEIVTEFEETHDQLAHLILVRRDLTRFQHLHPKLGENGRWSVEFTLPDPGVYRAFVDILVDGQPTTLGVDLFSSGPADYEISPDSTHEDTAEGYDAVMSLKSASPDENTMLEFEISNNGNTVSLDPYLGALGHLVAIRDGDLAYLHVHPEETDPEDGIIRFSVRFPTTGQYRLFLQAKPSGELITTTFDIPVERS